MFDYDGVVVDSLEAQTAALLEACRHFGVTQIASQEDMLALYHTNVFAGMAAVGLDAETIAAVRRRSSETIARAVPWLRAFPLVPQVIAELADEFYVVIATSSATALVEEFIRRRRIEGVAEIQGAEAGLSKIPKIEKLIERFPGQDVYWYVGDTVGDMSEARLAGAEPVGVAWGWHDPEELLAAGAVHVAGTPAELLAIISKEQVDDFFGTGREG